MFVRSEVPQVQQSKSAARVLEIPPPPPSCPCKWLKNIVHKIFPNNSYVDAAVTQVCQVAAKVHEFVSSSFDTINDYMEEAKEATRPFWTRFFSIFPSFTSPDDDKHFRIEDIQRMAKKSIGLRHLSSDDDAWHEWANGIKNGCSFNLTFQRSESFFDRDKTPFSRLPEELASTAISKEEKLKKLAEYEKAVDGHILRSLIMDLPIRVEIGKTRVGDLIEGVKKTSFVMIDYADYPILPTDVSQYGGLGRFPKSSVDRERVKRVLAYSMRDPSIKNLNKKAVLRSKVAGDRLFSMIVDSVRADLLNNIRSHDFDNDFRDQTF